MRLLTILFLFITVYLFPQRIVLENFETVEGWKVFKSDGVDLSFSTAKGKVGNAIKIEYNFSKGSGYGGIQKRIPVEFPQNFKFTYFIKGESPENNFEFKLIDSTGNSVWWVNNRSFQFPSSWKEIGVKRRNIDFAWGPISDKSLKRIAFIEFTIASAVGGKGVAYLDELTFEPLEIPDGKLDVQNITAIPEYNLTGLNKLTDKNNKSIWYSEKRDKQDIILDFGKLKEIGGLVIHWDRQNFPNEYSVLLSSDGVNYERLFKGDYQFGFASYVPLPEAEARYIKIEMRESVATKFGIAEIEIKDIAYSRSKNDFISNIAKVEKRGYFPRYFYGEKSYWTITGVVDDTKESLINEEGMIETDKNSFSLEPALKIGDKIYNWNDVKTEQGLEDGYLPIPFVIWESKDFKLKIRMFADGKPNESSVLNAEYEIVNKSNSDLEGDFFLLIRPFQVNPSYQFLNSSGGVAKISRLENLDNKIVVNDKEFHYSDKPNKISFFPFSSGNIYTIIESSLDKSVTSLELNDEYGLASGVLSYKFSLKSGEKARYYFSVPYHTDKKIVMNEEYESSFNRVKKEWIDILNKTKIIIPGSDSKIFDILRSNLAYILINKDNAGIQPGSRSYERSWIRDGSLTSSALLKLGMDEEVKKFIEWYSAYQYESGKIPCVVDKRGPDPVPENDSHGEYLFLLNQYFNYTKDTLLLRKYFPNIIKTVEYIESLVSTRKSDELLKSSSDSMKAFYGIMPESISHEGYSEKPMHSNWDNLFTIKGLKDAVTMAEVLREEKYLRKFSKIRDEFAENYLRSISLSMKYKKIDYIPGCVELGDFDATSTTIALYPCNEQHRLPKKELENTFDIYYDFFIKRKENGIDWVNYTPYEVRTIGSMILLGQKEKAAELIEYFLNDSRPKGWNHWAEVVWKDYRLPRFIGDMPHTWVGSDFINSIRMAFCYEDEFIGSLVLGLGIKEDWIKRDNGISVKNLRTLYGKISFTLKEEEEKIIISINGDGFNMPENFIRFAYPLKEMIKPVFINGEKVIPENGYLIIKEIPERK